MHHRLTAHNPPPKKGAFILTVTLHGIRADSCLGLPLETKITKPKLGATSYCTPCLHAGQRTIALCRKQGCIVRDSTIVHAAMLLQQPLTV